MIIVQGCSMVTVHVDVVLTKHLQLICILEKSMENVFVYKTFTASHNQYLLPCSSFRTVVGRLKVRLLCEVLPSMYRDLLQLLQTQLTKFTESLLLLLVNRAHRQTDRQSCYSGPCPNNTLIGLFPETNFLLCPRKPGVKFWSLYITYVQVMDQVHDVLTSRNKNEEIFSLKFVNNVGGHST